MTQTYQTNAQGAKRIKKFYIENQVEVHNPYITFCAKLKDCTISLYSSNKVVFQGNKIEEETAIWDMDTDFQNTSKEKKTTSKNEVLPTLPQTGSDEVGTGDYFGPVCVCASYVDEEIYSKIKQYNITDSKKLTDSYIYEIGEQIRAIVPHSLLILTNQKYNDIHKTNNLNAIKAKLHNSCYLHLSEKVTMPKLNVVDQFAEEPIYYHYLKKEEKVFRELHFETKAESKYIAVATSSIISRYAFLKTLEKMNEAYQTEFPKGAGSKVDTFIQHFVAEHGVETLYKVAKIHFKNTEKAKQ